MTPPPLQLQSAASDPSHDCDQMFTVGGASHHFDGMDGIMDDLMSVPESVGSASMGTMSHTLTSTPASPDWRQNNTVVHMELQENAKLPTFYLPVNRSSTRTTSLSPQHQMTKYSTMHHQQQQQQQNHQYHNHNSHHEHQQYPNHQQQPSLMEQFLTQESRFRHHGQRHNHHQYSSMNDHSSLALSSKKTEPCTMEPVKELSSTHAKLPASMDCASQAKAASDGSISLMEDTDTDPLLMLMENVYPTPWSEMKQTHYIPRKDQLPIPSNNPIGTSTEVTTTTTPIINTTIPANTQSRPLPTATRIQDSRNPNHLANHAVPNPALQNASTKKTQYGFGRQHKVPSTVAEPNSKPTTVTIPSVWTSKTNATTTKTKSKVQQSTYTSPTSHIKSTTAFAAAPASRHSPTDSPPSGTNSNSGIAYERKKLRAKSARIKLNESIDRLSIAINLAGTESQTRATQIMDSVSKLSSTNASAIHIIMKDCVKTARDAKKWDRPSFVGSAATLIQGMNAQCEALMREIEFLHHQQQQQQQQQQCIHGDDNFYHDIDDIGSIKHALLGSSQNHDLTKRRRLNGFGCGSTVTTTTTTCSKVGTSYTNDHLLRTSYDSLIFTERSIMERVASFLEPLSIVRCMQVSKVWKDWGIFSKEILWQNLAVERYGLHNVRQWRGRYEGEDVLAQEYKIKCSWLYQTMDAANVMPHLRQEGMIPLGQTRLKGKVSAWTFLVERSNGETMRSVLRPPNAVLTRDNSYAGQYTSIPVVQLWTIVQNTGIHDEAVILREQCQTVDASTRRRGEEFQEITWDSRFRKRFLNLDGTMYEPGSSMEPSFATTAPFGAKEICRLKLFEAIIVECNIHATGCSTTSKFVQRSNFTKILVQIRNGTTVPLVIPFPRDSTHLQF